MAMSPPPAGVPLEVWLITDTFTAIVRALAGEMRRAGLPDARRGMAAGQVAVVARALEGLWNETVRAYLRSPAARLARAGNPDVLPGYAHLLTVLAPLGSPGDGAGLRRASGRLSAEICRTIGRLLVLDAHGIEGSFEPGMAAAQAAYLDAFGLRPKATPVARPGGGHAPTTPIVLPSAGG